MRLYQSILVTALVSASFTNVVNAADSSFRVSLDAKSRRVGVGHPSLPILVRLAGPGREMATAKLLNRLGASSSLSVRIEAGATTEVSDDRSRTTAGDWSLTVFADGTKAKFQNYAYLTRHPELIRKVERRMPQEEAEKRGAAFIASELSEFVVVGSNEALVPLKTIYEIRQAQSVNSKTPDPAEAVSTTAVFSRTVNGVAIVGTGSKVAVTMANDGKVVAFDYDWAPLAYGGEQQEVLGLSSINRRAAGLSGKNMSPGSVAMKHFECGYADLGARKAGSGSVLQPACVLQYLDEKAVAGGIITSGHGYLIPTGVNVRADKGWPEAQALCLGSDVCTPAMPPPSGN